MNAHARWVAQLDQLQAAVTNFLDAYGLERDANTDIVAVFLKGVVAAMPTYDTVDDLPTYQTLLNQYNGTRDFLAMLVTILLPTSLDSIEQTP